MGGEPTMRWCGSSGGEGWLQRRRIRAEEQPYDSHPRTRESVVRSGRAPATSRSMGIDVARARARKMRRGVTAKRRVMRAIRDAA
eukprot:4908820-Pleurochrysis_carterae.AAC.1